MGGRGGLRSVLAITTGRHSGTCASVPLGAGPSHWAGRTGTEHQGALSGEPES